jgi:hypothetical protein
MIQRYNTSLDPTLLHLHSRLALQHPFSDSAAGIPPLLACAPGIARKGVSHEAVHLVRTDVADVQALYAGLNAVHAGCRQRLYLFAVQVRLHFVKKLQLHRSACKLRARRRLGRPGNRLRQAIRGRTRDGQLPCLPAGDAGSGPKRRNRDREIARHTGDALGSDDRVAERPKKRGLAP